MTDHVGTMSLSEDGKRWQIQCEPHASMWLKRLFPKIDVNSDPITLPADDEHSRDLEWFCQRYPLRSEQILSLYRKAESHRERQSSINRIIHEGYTSRTFELKVPPREYQKIGAAWMLEVKRGLLADEVGVGKTCTAIAFMSASGMLPGAVVCDTHLVRQWQREINRFVPSLKTHIVRTVKPYDITEIRKPGGQIKHEIPDVVIIPYSKIVTWSRELADTYHVNLVVFDEVQALRRRESERYSAAKYLADRTKHVIGMSATPIYNYGGEIFNIARVIFGEGRLGTREEFFREWCVNTGEERKARLKDPGAFGAWMRANHMMLRRTRKDVNRELPGLQRITHVVDADPEYLKQVEGQAGALARMMLAEVEQNRGDRMRASEEFSNALRQATGLAKAPYVAAFVDLLVENGESVVLFGWHHAVYGVWMERLKQHNPKLYTGLQSVAQKEEAVQAFRSGESKVLIVSLRAGAGLDGLQHVSSTAVIGELDWSPMVIKQCIGRLDRDGQENPVTAYILVAEDGLDPVMTEVLGIKQYQSERMLTEGELELQQRIDSGAVLRRLAEQYAKKSPSGFGNRTYRS